MKLCPLLSSLVLSLLVFGFASAQGGFLVEVDTDGVDDGVLTYSPNFAFGGDTTSASQSVASLAFGLTGGDSIFGGNGSSSPDTYLFTYDPSVDADNLAIPADTPLGGGDLASGLAGGQPGVYAIYAAWPFTGNVSGGATSFSASTSGNSFATLVDQNGLGNEWIKLGEINWTSGLITLTQEAGQNTFVSMRSAGVLFERLPAAGVPDGGSTLFLALIAVGSLPLVRRLRRA